MQSERAAAVAAVTNYIEAANQAWVTRIAIDGVTASGKSTFANEIAAELENRNFSILRLTMDGYHNPKAIRYRKGRMSPMGYYEDAYDFEAFVDLVLRPLGPGGSSAYVPKIFDLESDTAVTTERITPPENGMLIVDGSFLQRPNVVDHWDVRVFVDTSMPEAERRGIERDHELLGGREVTARIYKDRYHAAAHHYIKVANPAASADVRLLNDDLTNPIVEVKPNAN